VDKTRFLAESEKCGRFLFFIRPRRFGKSLFLSLIASYYDALNKDRFEALFKDTHIFDHPIEGQGKYLMLALNFSQVGADENKIEDSFVNHVRNTAADFIRRYRDRLSANSKLDYYSENIETGNSAEDIFSSLMTLCRGANQSLYVIIDEYDNFANTILTTSGESAYHALTHGECTLRSFFNMVKGGTTGNDAPVKRLFITGVSPVTMDDVTSGFNIGSNISMDAALNQMVGFSRQETEVMLAYYRDAGLITHSSDELLELFDFWYGNYLFSDYSSDGQRLYNSDMILYFLREYMKRQAIPKDLIDRNVRIDYGKLRHLIVIDHGKNSQPTANGNFSKLKEIIAEGGTTTAINAGFPVDQLTQAHTFKSLLFYLGLLTIKAPERDRLRLMIPNETIRRLYYDFIESAYRETGVFALDLSKYADLMSDFAYDGAWRPLFDFITGQMTESISLRDLMTAEKSIQTFLNVYLGLSNLFIIHSEKELNMGFSDLVMEPFTARYETIKFSCIIELKYLKSDAEPDDPAVKALAAEALTQLKKYAMDKKYIKTIAGTSLIKLVLVFSGHRLVYMGEV